MQVCAIETNFENRTGFCWHQSQPEAWLNLIVIAPWVAYGVRGMTLSLPQSDGINTTEQKQEPNGISASAAKQGKW